MTGFGQWWKEHWKEIGGAALGLLLLLFLFKTSNVGQVIKGFRDFNYWLLPIIFALVAGREAVRVVEWHLLLRRLDILARWNHSVMALLGGDAAQIIPAGIFLSNVLLKREEEASVSRSLPATLAVQYLEVVVSLLILVALGVRGWWWMRPAALIILAGFLSFFYLITRGGAVDWLERRAGRGRKVWGKILNGVRRTLEGIEGLLDWKTLIAAGLLATAHLALTIASLYTIMAGLAMHADWRQAAVTYAFVLTVVNLNPFPTDVGISEGSGMSIFVSDGVPAAQGLTAMLLVRFAIILSTAVLLAIATLALPRATRHLVSGSRPEDAAANARTDPDRDEGDAAEPPPQAEPLNSEDERAPLSS